MHVLAFSAVAVPLIGLFFLLCIALVSSLVSDGAPFRRLFSVFLVCQLAVMAFRIACVARKSAARLSRKRRRLPEFPAATIEDKFAMPVVEEWVKFLVLACAAGCATASTWRSYVLLVGAVFAANKLVCTLVTFSPIHYARHYARFSKSWEKFQCRASPPADKLSISPTLEPAALVSSCSDETKPLFKLDFFESESPSAIALPSSGPADVPQAHPHMIDRLFSVSPKDTMYFSYEHFQARSESTTKCDILLESSSRSGSSSGSENMDCISEYLGGDPEEASAASQNRGMAEEIQPSSPLQNQGGSEETVYPYSKTKVQQPTSSPQPAYSPWAWLFPWCNTKVPKASMPRKRERALIKKKLSTFTLNSAYEKRVNYSVDETASLKSSWSRASYGTVDLESQECHKAPVENSHTYYEYARFSNNYLDVASGSGSPNLDPSVVKFGTPIPHLSTPFFTMYACSVCMWQFSSALLLSMPFAGGNISLFYFFLNVLGLVVAKLFCVNYLHRQCTLSYMVCVGAEFVLNIALFSACYVYSTCTNGY